MTRGRLISLVPAAAVPEGGKQACSADGLDVLLCNVEGTIYALENRCSHAASRLDIGKLKGHTIGCPLHGARFDVRDGRYGRRKGQHRRAGAAAGATEVRSARMMTISR